MSGFDGIVPDPEVFKEVVALSSVSSCKSLMTLQVGSSERV